MEKININYIGVVLLVLRQGMMWRLRLSRQKVGLST